MFLVCQIPCTEHKINQNINNFSYCYVVHFYVYKENQQVKRPLK